LDERKSIICNRATAVSVTIALCNLVVPESTGNIKVTHLVDNSDIVKCISDIV